MHNVKEEADILMQIIAAYDVSYTIISITEITNSG